MPGIRIQHAFERNCTFTLVDGSRRYPTPWKCPPPPAGCDRTHEFKAYHIRLDDSGAAIVSIEVWQRIERIGPGSGFSRANVVEAPPEQKVRVPLTKLKPTVIAPSGTVAKDRGG